MRKVFEEMNELMDEATSFMASQMNAETLSMMDDDTVKGLQLYGKLIVIIKEYLGEMNTMMNKIDEINSKLDIVLLTKK